MDYAKLGAKIKAYRLQAHLTHKELARLAGISTAFIGHIERGTRKPSIETLISIAQSLDTTVDDLLDISMPKKCCPELEKYSSEQISAAIDLLDLLTRSLTPATPTVNPRPG